MKTGLTVASERAAIVRLAINTIRTLCMDAVRTKRDVAHHQRLMRRIGSVTDR
jgi:hypothetical protein